MATCSSTSCPEAFPSSGVEPAANVAEAATQGGSDPHRVLRGEDCSLAGGQGRRADLLVGNNVLAQVPDLNDFVKGMKISAQAPRCSHARVPAPDEADGGEPVRHDLPRALLVLLAHHDGQDLGVHRSDVFDVEELPTHGGSLRVYARQADDTSKPVGERVSRELAGRPGAGLMASRCYASFGEQVKETKRKLLSSSSRPSAKGKRSPGTGPGKREHAAELLRHPFRLPRLHGGPQPVQARQIPPRDPHPHLSSRQDQGSQTGLRAYPALEPEDEIMEQVSYIRELGRAVRRAHPRGESLRLTSSASIVVCTEIYNDGAGPPPLSVGLFLPVPARSGPR